jgi:hypothetical protein
MKHLPLFVLSLVAVLIASCGKSNEGAQSSEDTLALSNETIQTKPVVVERELAKPDVMTFGLCQYGRVKTITSDDMLAEIPVINFNGQGELSPSKPMEVVMRDNEGRPIVHNGGKMGKDSTGFVFHCTYQYIGESMQVASVYTENTTDMKTLLNLKRYTYAGDNISPSTMCEFQQTSSQPAANYSTYTYISIDEQGNWTEREVKNYYFAHPDFLSPELMNRVKEESVSAEAEAQLIEHLEEATATSYTEYRTIEYYE